MFPTNIDIKKITTMGGLVITYSSNKKLVGIDLENINWLRFADGTRVNLREGSTVLNPPGMICVENQFANVTPISKEYIGSKLCLQNLFADVLIKELWPQNPNRIHIEIMAADHFAEMINFYLSGDTVKICGQLESDPYGSLDGDDSLFLIDQTFEKTISRRPPTGFLITVFVPKGAEVVAKNVFGHTVIDDSVEAKLVLKLSGGGKVFASDLRDLKAVARDKGYVVSYDTKGSVNAKIHDSAQLHLIGGRVSNLDVHVDGNALADLRVTSHNGKIVVKDSGVAEVGLQIQGVQREALGNGKFKGAKGVFVRV